MKVILAMSMFMDMLIVAMMVMKVFVLIVGVVVSIVRMPMAMMGVAEREHSDQIDN